MPDFQCVGGCGLSDYPLCFPTPDGRDGGIRQMGRLGAFGAWKCRVFGV